MSNTYCSVLLRLGLAIVFGLFGRDKLTHPEHWVVFLTPQVTRFFPFGPYEFLKFQGVAETLLATALLSGFMTRLASAAAAGLLVLIVVFLWPDPVAVRDVGLFFATLALIFAGPGKWSLDSLLAKAEK